MWHIVFHVYGAPFLIFLPQLALTGASPIWRGYLADVDCRWNVIAGSVDDRTPGERGVQVCNVSR